MAKSVDKLSSDYESALAAHQDDPADEGKRAAADKAAKRLTDARADARADRGGVTAVSEDNDPGGEG